MRSPLFSWLLLFYSIPILFATDEVLVCGQCLEDQRYLLLQLNQSLSFHDNRPTDSKLASWKKSTDCCGWKGVTCDPVSGRVIGLDLSNEYIVGGIGSLFNLRYLQSLNLADNYYLNSTLIPSELVKLVDLTHLNLSNTDFEGQVPIEISHLTRLVSLDLSTYGQLRLEKPDLKTLVQNLSRLRTLSLDGVNVSANGNQWGQALSSSLPNLQVLSLSFCDLSSPLDSLLSTLPRQLHSLDLSGNNLTGPIPPLPKALTHLNLAYNNLTGPLPDSLWKRLQLVSLDLSRNNLTGPIPPLPETLTQLNLAYNSLKGPLPDSLWKRFVKLVNLDLWSNSLNGTIPSSLFTLPTLKALQLGHNQFSGQLMEFATPLLEILRLSSNKLEGPIPLSIFELQHLTLLGLSSNNFSGTVQLEMIQKLQNLTTLALSYNSLLINTTVHNSNSSFPKFVTLKLASCKLRCFPDFLKRNQSSLTILDLSNNQIHGQIPIWVWKIGGGALRYLNLSFNFFNNLEQPFPDLSNSSLASLDLHSNLLQVLIPILSSSLFYLDFSHNNFQSIIPSNLIGSTFDGFLSLSSNNLTGEIPQSICNAGLQVLDLSNNRLNGTIPSCLGNMNDTLRTLDLSGNRLRGPLPTDLAKCTKLQFVNLGNNQINGSFPFWLGSCTDLRVLVLRSNRFSGPIKGDGTNHTFSKLQILDLSWNNFTGNLPSEFFKKWAAMKADKDETTIKAEPLILKFTGPSQIYYQDTVVVSIKGRELTLTKILTTYFCVDLSNNGFQGEIPDGIGNLTALYTLNLSHNALTGSIPSSLGNLKQLESLDLSCNKLQGEIPQQLTSLTFLSVLNLSWNELTGRIPMGTQFQSFPETSFGGNEGLCGAPLSKNCEHIEPAASPPTTSSSKKPQLFGYDWDFVLSGFVVGFGGGAGIIVAFFLFSDQGRKWLLARSRV